jgi:DNA helicase-2/ATP-dependent DNA helicase PcrA
MPSNNCAVLAVAGARKTQTLVDEALSDPSRRVLVTTYTVQNLREITRRIEHEVSVVPPNVQVASWFSFLLGDGIRPYQSAVLGEIGVVRGLNFIAQKHRYMPRTSRAFYLDSNHDVFRDGMADFVCYANAKSGGMVVGRLEARFDHIYIDEVQDLVGHDLELLDLLLKSKIDVTVVGDPRQAILETNRSPKNKRYRGAGLCDWFDERVAYCQRDNHTKSWRCNQSICDFASDLFPELDRLCSARDERTGHDGIFTIPRTEAAAYAETYQPMVLRRDKTTDTLGLPAINIGVSKGSTFDRVMIFTTEPMRRYIKERDHSKLKDRERLYVAVTRARHSVAFVL